MSSSLASSLFWSTKLLYYQYVHLCNSWEECKPLEGNTVIAYAKFYPLKHINLIFSIGWGCQRRKRGKGECNGRRQMEYLVLSLWPNCIKKALRCKCFCRKACLYSEQETFCYQDSSIFFSCFYQFTLCFSNNCAPSPVTGRIAL